MRGVLRRLLLLLGFLSLTGGLCAALWARDGQQHPAILTHNGPGGSVVGELFSHTHGDPSSSSSSSSTTAMEAAATGGCACGPTPTSAWRCGPRTAEELMRMAARTVVPMPIVEVGGESEGEEEDEEGEMDGGSGFFGFASKAALGDAGERTGRRRQQSVRPVIVP